MALRSPGGDEHVHLAAGPDAGDLVGQPISSSVSLPMALTTSDDVVAVPDGARHVVGDLADAIGVGDRRAAELLDDQSHDG
jgi:hypothetical protein